MDEALDEPADTVLVEALALVDGVLVSVLVELLALDVGVLVALPLPEPLVLPDVSLAVPTELACWECAAW